LRSGHPLKESGFTEAFLKINYLDDVFAEWIFYPGMLFNSPDLWWQGAGKRSRPHEGLDICYYRDRRGDVRSVPGEARVPVISAGSVAGVEKDFLGWSVYVRHEYPPGEEGHLYTVYGHLSLSPGIGTGKCLHTGEILGMLADTALRSPHIPPHLHLTSALIRGIPSPEQLTWKAMWDTDSITLVDPLVLLDGKYQVLACQE